MIDACPINGETVDEPTVRLVAGLTLALGVFLFLMPLAWVAALLTADFALRGFGWRRYSPLRWVAKWLGRLLGLKPRRINAGPKVFAARIGLGMTALITVLLAAHLFVLADVLLGMLVACALLESAFGYCVGCQVYAWLPSGLRRGSV